MGWLDACSSAVPINPGGAASHQSAAFAAAPLGRREKFRLGGSLPPDSCATMNGSTLRSRDFITSPRMSHDRQYVQTTRMKIITSFRRLRRFFRR